MESPLKFILPRSRQGKRIAGSPYYLKAYRVRFAAFDWDFYQKTVALLR